MIPFIDFDNDFLDTETLLFLSSASGGTGVEATATGNPLVFTTDLARPLKSLLIPFTPQQEGSGDPSPSNIRSILPWNGLTVFGGGKNLFNESSVTFNRWISSNGVESSNQGGCVSDYIPVKSGAVVALSFSGLKPYSGSVCEYDKSKGFINRQHKGWQDGAGTNEPLIATLDNNTAFIRVQIYATSVSGTQTAEMLASEQIQLEAGQTATAYEPYKPITDTDIVFPSPVYGGQHEAVSGKLMSEFIPVDLSTMGFTYRSGWNCWVANADSRFETVASNNAPTRALTAEAKAVGASGYTSSHPANTFAQNTNGVWFFDNGSDTDAPEGYLIVPLATPTEQTLTGHQITALVGDNTIWSDADGSMTAVYLKKG